MEDDFFYYGIAIQLYLTKHPLQLVETFGEGKVQLFGGEASNPLYLLCSKDNSIIATCTLTFSF